MPRFKKNDIIEHQRHRYRCIVADTELAVFAPVVLKKYGGAKTKMSTGLFVVSNDLGIDTFEYKMLGKIGQGGIFKELEVRL